MSRGRWVLLTLALCLAAGWAAWGHKPGEGDAGVGASSSNTEPQAGPAASAPPAPDAAPVPAAAAAHAAPSPGRAAEAPEASADAESAAAVAAAAAREGSAEAAPSVAQVRDEALRDPEAPSQAVLRFSVDMEKRMKSALATEEGATAYLPELSHCALGDGAEPVAESARALCLSNADRLAAKYPALKSQYDSVEARADARVVQIKKMMDR